MRTRTTSRTVLHGAMLLTSCAVFIADRVTSAADLSRESLHAAYANVRTISAEIEQTKTSPYLYKPLVSRIQLEYADGRVLWRIQEPAHAEFVFAGGTISTKGSLTLPPEAAERLAALMRFLQAVFSVDLATMERDFKLEISDNSLEARPKADSEIPFVKRLLFRFGPDLSPAQLTVETGDETTELKFLRFAVSSAAMPTVTP